MTAADDRLRELLATPRTRRSFAGEALSIGGVDAVLNAGLGNTINGRKTAPCASALYPMRLFVAVVRNVEGLAPGLYGWDAGTGPRPARQSGDLGPALQTAALEEQTWGRPGASHDRDCGRPRRHQRCVSEQQPDGRRGEHYAAMEAGAIAQSIYLITEALGLAGTLIGGIDDTATRTALALPDRLTPLPCS